MEFNRDYFSAQAAFCRLATERGFTLERHTIDAPGAQGEALSIDVACSADDPVQGWASTTLLITTGLHGVEGFFGSAALCAALERWDELEQASRGLRWVLVHALNPFGYAHLRRCDENNVDLNRNFLAESEEYRGAADRYIQLDALLNPRRRPSRWEPIRLKAAAAIARYGIAALKQAVAGGQYDFPQGLFYGGAKPSAVTRIVQSNLEHWIANAKQALHLDLHTGLGDWGGLKLLIDYPLPPFDLERLRRGFGGAVEVSSSRGTAYTTRGGMGRWCVEHIRSRRKKTASETEYLFLLAEFGTYPPLTVLAGLRAENQAHHWGKPNEPATWRAKQRLKELFVPMSISWRKNAVDKFLGLVKTAARILVDKSMN